MAAVVGFIIAGVMGDFFATAALGGIGVGLLSVVGALGFTETGTGAGAEAILGSSLFK
jgi:hypothetical protein